MRSLFNAILLVLGRFTAAVRACAESVELWMKLSFIWGWARLNGRRCGVFVFKWWVWAIGGMW